MPPPAQSRTAKIWIARALAALLAIAVLATAGLLANHGLEAAQILRELAHGCHDCALPTRTPVRYEGGEGDLYRGAAAPLAGIVLVPGATRAGRDDPSLVSFAETLARARFLVLVPELVGARMLTVGPAEIDDVAAAVRHLAGAIDPVGIAAVSYGTGPALLATLRPEVNRLVRFVVAIGGYYDATAAITYFTTGRFKAEPEQGWKLLEPNAYGRWVFVAANADKLGDARDRTTLAAIAGRKLHDLAAPVDDLTATLGDEGRAVMALLTNRDPDRVPELIWRLPPGIRDDILALDPSRAGLAGLRARLIIVHGRDDRIVPYGQSVALARAAPPGHARLFLLGHLRHARLDLGGIVDAWTLWRAIRALLEERG